MDPRKSSSHYREHSTRSNPITKSDKQLLNCDESEIGIGTLTIDVLSCVPVPSERVAPTPPHSNIPSFPHIGTRTRSERANVVVGFNSTWVGIKTFKSLPNFRNISTRNAIRFLPPREAANNYSENNKSLSGWVIDLGWRKELNELCLVSWSVLMLPNLT